MFKVTIVILQTIKYAYPLTIKHILVDLQMTRSSLDITNDKKICNVNEIIDNYIVPL